MPYFQIHGHPSCPNFGHAIVVSDYLSGRLPNFQYKKVVVATRNWGEHLIDINKNNGWFITKSPLVWKEINNWGGKKYLIGGLGDYWEYIYCYYGLESRIPRLELNKLAEANAKFYEEKEEEAAQRINNIRVVSIIGASNLLVTLLLQDLLKVPNLSKKDGIIVRLYEESIGDLRKHKVMIDIADYYNSLQLFGSEEIVVVTESLKDTLELCELLLIVEDFKVQPGQDENPLLKLCYARMNFLSEVITGCKHPNMRIVIAVEGPACFLGTCLVELCTTVCPSNIVVVAADVGLSYIPVVAEKIGVAVSRIAAPPVWGFIGMNVFVDLTQTVFKADIYRPNARSLTAPRGSTLPLGTIKSELRLMSYLIADHDEIERIVQERKNIVWKTLDRSPVFGKIRSIISLLKLWYAEDTSDEIISLGVCSNGSFGIPPGVVFSQPVILDSKRRWVPYAEFPLMNDNTIIQVENMMKSASDVLKQFELLQYFCKDDVDICSNPDCPLNIDNDNIT